MVATSGENRARWRVARAAGVLLCLTVPLWVAGVNPWTEVPAVYEGADPLLQTAILHHVSQNPPLSAEAWQAPFLWPARFSLAFMDPLWGQSLLVVWLPQSLRSVALTYNLALGMTLALAFGATVLLGRGLRFSRAASMLAGLVYALGPYSMSHLQHLNQLPSPWLPLALWGLLELSRGRAAAGVTLSISLLLQLVSGVYGTVATALSVVVLLPFLASGRWRRRSVLACVASLALFALGLWLWSIPYGRAAAANAGFARDASDVGPFAARLSDLWRTPRPHLLPWPPPAESRPALYPGALWGLLAAVGLVRSLRDRRLRGWWIGMVTVAGVGFVLALGRSHPWPGSEAEIPLPLAWLQDHVSPLRAIRAPARMLLPASLLLALLGSRWLDAGRARIAGWAVLGLALVDLAPGGSGRVRVTPDAQERAVIETLAELPETSAWTAFPQPCRERDESVLDARLMLWAVLSQRPVAGGSSGFVPAEIVEQRRRCCAGLGRGCASWLQRSGVRTVVVPRGFRLEVPASVVHRSDLWEVHRLLALQPESGRLR